MADPAMITQSNAIAEEEPSSLASNAPADTLMTLPPELRNHIYDLVIVPSPSEDDEDGLYLLDAQPPSKDLLLVCRQMYNEARQMYRAAYRDFWSEDWLILDVRNIDKKPNVQAALARYMRGTRDIDIAHIQRLLIEGSEDCWWLEYGAWTWDAGDGDVEVLVLSPAKERLLSAAGFNAESHHSAATMRFIRTTDMSSEKKGEAVRLVGRNGLSKEEIVAVIEWVSSWHMLGPQTWMRDFD